MSEEETLAKECQEASLMLEKLVDKFDAIGWKDHASYVQTMASHLRIYVHQIKARIKK